MKFRSELKIPSSVKKRDYSNRFLSAGSCFAAHMADKLAFYQFRVLANPTGVMYNPLSLLLMLEHLYGSRPVDETFLVQDEGLWHSLLHDSSFSAPDREEVLRRITQAHDQNRQGLLHSDTWLITLGTARVYHHIERQCPAANCHKIAADRFRRHLLSVDEIVEILEKIKQLAASINPDIFILFSVSPVRHLKDGFHENTLSKARLHLAIEQITENNDNTAYFPAWEILMDDLRDYRFYKPDLIHPSEMAVDYIWQKFSAAWMTGEALEIMKEVEAIRKGLAHRPLISEHPGHEAFIKHLKQRQERLCSRFPFMRF